MAKSDNQKLKLLYIIKILSEQSGENSFISVKKLIELLDNYGIKAERKSIYNDIECLKDFGYDIEFNASKYTGGYYLASREFELAELKILVDMVQSSRFLTLKKSRELIKKLEAMTDKTAAQELQRTVYVSDRVKSENESVYYTVDLLSQAINDDKTVSFQYFEYSTKKEIKLKKDGGLYHISPYYLIFNSDNYYLVGYDNDLNSLRHYRVDRMKKVSITDAKREGKEMASTIDIASYTKGVFNMFRGEKVHVTLECSNELVNVIVDRFGRELSFYKNTEDTFTFSTDVYAGPQFYGWLAGLDGKVRIQKPLAIKNDFHDYIGRLYMIN